MSETQTESKSIVDPKYRETMVGASDWIGEIMEKTALTTGIGATDAIPEKTGKNGEIVQKAVPARKGKSEWDVDKMFALAERNAIDTSKYEDSKAAVGRMRMTLSNMLRARAKRRHGLFDINGKWMKAPEGFEVNETITEDRDGTKIPKKKAEKPAKEEVKA